VRLAVQRRTRYPRAPHRPCAPTPSALAPPGCLIRRVNKPALSRLQANGRAQKAVLSPPLLPLGVQGCLFIVGDPRVLRPGVLSTSLAHGKRLQRERGEHCGAPQPLPGCPRVIAPQDHTRKFDTNEHCRWSRGPAAGRAGLRLDARHVFKERLLSQIPAAGEEHAVSTACLLPLYAGGLPCLTCGPRLILRARGTRKVSLSPRTLHRALAAAGPILCRMRH
jgi:hypothetical protein